MLETDEKRHLMDDGTMPMKIEDGRILLIDQRKLPDAFEYFDATDLDAMCFAITDMVVRGAPSIGVAAALGMAAHLKKLASTGEIESSVLQNTKDKLDATRPTAVNLKWATKKVFEYAGDLLKRSVTGEKFGLQIFGFAENLLQDHLDRNRTLSEFGSALVPQGGRILTHCNAGSLAACGWGTALGVIRSAKLNGLAPSVFVDETRPRNQGSKLTMWELTQDNIPCTLISDSMSGFFMGKNEIDMVVTGADRIAANGDSANKIGTYGVAVLANYHKIPFYIAAPLSTIDPNIESGAQIPIEFRDTDELKTLEGKSITVSGAAALNPAFDVTPAALIKGIITEEGVLYPPFSTSIKEALERDKSTSRR